MFCTHRISPQVFRLFGCLLACLVWLGQADPVFAADQLSIIPYGYFEASGQVVDEGGNPVAGAEIFVPRKQALEVVTVSDREGKFKFVLHRKFRRKGFAVYANSQDGKQQAYFRLGHRYFRDKTKENETSIRLVMKPERKVTVVVKNGYGERMSGMPVRAMLSKDEYIYKGNTKNDGTVTLELPQDAELSYIFSLKAHVGFDIKEYWGEGIDPRTSKVVNPAKRVGDSVELVLNGSKKIRVVTVDEQGNPLEGMTVYPADWTLFHNRDAEGAATLITSVQTEDIEELRVVSDKEGVAEFDWIPARKGTLRFSAHSDQYKSVEDAVLHPTEGRTVTVRMQNTVQLNGVVRNKKGELLSDYRVEYSWIDLEKQRNLDDETIVTDQSGRFQLELPRGRSYVFLANDKDTVATPYSLVLSGESPLTQDVEIVVDAGAKVFGRVSDSEGESIVNKPVILFYSGLPLPQLLEGKESVTEELKRHSSPSGAVVVFTDSEGAFEFKVGQGKYGLASSHSKQFYFLEVPRKEPLEFNFVHP